MSRNNTGNPIDSKAFPDFEDNVKNLDQAVNAEQDTFQDRLGKSRLTWAGIVKAGTGDAGVIVPIVQQAAQDAASAVIAGVNGQVAAAEVAADRAEAASDSAFVNADVYPDIAAGLAAVAAGEQFQVLSADGMEYRRYRKDSDTVATEVGNGFASPALVDGKLPIKNSRNLFNKDAVTLGVVILPVNGTTVANEPFYVSGYIPVKPGTAYTFSMSSSPKPHSFYDKDKKFISSGENASTLTTPAGAAFARISARIAEISPSEYMFVEGGTIPARYEAWVGEMAVRVKDINTPDGPVGVGSDGKIPIGVVPFNGVVNLFDPSAMEDGVYYGVSGPVVNDGFYTTDFIPVSYGDVISWSTVPASSKFRSFWGPAKNFISARILEGGIDVVDVPGAAYIRISPRHNETPVSSFMVIKGTREQFPQEYMHYGQGSPENIGSKNVPHGYAGLDADGKIPASLIPDIGGGAWVGRTIVALGDSITYGFIPRNAPGYPGQLQSYLPLAANRLGANHINYGVTGTTIGDNGTAGDTCFTKRYLTMADDADLIIVMGGTNDLRKGVPIGTMSDRTDSTFYGALHVLCQGLIDKYYIAQTTVVGKSKQIMFMTPIKLQDPATSGLDVGLVPFAQAVREVCAYYSIPVLDLYNLSGITPHILQTVQGAEPGYTGMYNPYITDGTHPTQDGQEKMARIVAGFIKSLS